MYEEFHDRALYFNGIFMLRRFLYAFSLVLFRHHGYFQWLAYMGLSTFNLAILIHMKPFKKRLTNAFEIFNEGTILMTGYALILVSDINDDMKAKYSMGWLIVAIASLNVVVNLVYIIIVSLGRLPSFFGQLARRCKKTRTLQIDTVDLNDNF